MTTVVSPPDQLIVLHDISWETYERLLDDRIDSSGPRVTYDRGELEILGPSFEHEIVNRTLALLVEEVAVRVGDRSHERRIDDLQAARDVPLVLIRGAAIRRALRADTDAIDQAAALLVEAFPHWLPTMELARDEVMEALETDRICLVARAQDQILGWIGAHPRIQSRLGAPSPGGES